MNINISVCIASYNGAAFIEKQLLSVLKQLHQDDEVILVDDCSTDNTLEVVKSLNDSRIKIFNNPVNKGCVATFEHAIKLANNDIVFMCDQDDLWVEGRAAILKNAIIKEQVLLVTSNMNYIDDQDKPLPDYRLDGVKKSQSKKYVKNITDMFIGKTSYYGCTMAFKKDFRNLFLPFPDYVVSHDLWIAMAANISRSNYHCDEVTLSRRIHGSNLSLISRKLPAKLWSRVIFAISIMHILIRKIR